jgi:cob(I)alamin adenosyltransferase
MSATPQRGYVQVYTGDGKGKTTAALGLAVRAAGAGLRVFIGQFVKGRPSSEQAALDRFGDTITLRQFGRECFIHGAPTAEDIRCAEAGLDEARRVLEDGRHALVILDEANVAVQLGLFPVERILDLLAVRPPHVELVLTGRGADPRVLAQADLVTDMRAVKHYFARGVPARRGIEL